MDPDWAFDTFCRESGFATAHGMSAKASSTRPTPKGASALGAGKDIFSSSTTPFIPAGEAMLSRIEPGAIGSVADEEDVMLFSQSGNRIGASGERGLLSDDRRRMNHI